jgi:hypothetical protein
MSGSAATTPRVPTPTAGAVGAAAALARAGVVARRHALPYGVLVCLALAAVSLLAPSQPTYDPWAWIVWGREILHLDLNTIDGPSWKPLPVAFTTVFALFGSIAPALWIVVARAGALYGVLAAFRLGRRLGGVPGGAAAAAGLVLAPWYVRNASLANSEGVQVAFALAAVERHLRGDRRAAFLLALGLGLLRPEAWAFVGAYGLWLAWTERSRLWLIACGLASLPILWLAPEKLGSGDLLRASHRAQHPVGNSAAFADNPVVQVLREGAAMLTPPVWAGLAAMVAFAIWRRERRVALLVAGIAAWVLLVAAMTANGYSGNQRYLIVPAALVIVLAGAGAGRAVSLLRPRTTAAIAGLAVVLAAAFAGPPAHRVAGVLRGTAYQATLVRELGPMVQRAGGAARLRACGNPYTGAYLVPAVAWQLHLHTAQVHVAPVQWPAVVFRVRTTQTSGAVPPLGTLLPTRTAARNEKWRILEACR